MFLHDSLDEGIEKFVADPLYLQRALQNFASRRIFSIPIDNHWEDLKNGHVSEGLKKEFEGNNRKFSSNTTFIIQIYSNVCLIKVVGEDQYEIRLRQKRNQADVLDVYITNQSLCTFNRLIDYLCGAAKRGPFFDRSSLSFENSVEIASGGGSVLDHFISIEEHQETNKKRQQATIALQDTINDTDAWIQEMEDKE